MPAASKVHLATLNLSNPGIDETVLRTIGSISVRTDQNATGVQEEQIGAFGFIPVTDAAIAAGVTAMPGPGTDGTQDGWFVYLPFAFTFNNVTSIGFTAQMANRVEFDSKAKRIVSSGQSVAVIAENRHATHGFEIRAQFRMLSQVRGTS